MSADALRRYRFATDAQWNACLLVQTDRVTSPTGVELQPFASYERQATSYPSNGAHAPVATRLGEVLWRDDDGCLHRLEPCDERPSITCPAPAPIARAERVVAGPNSLWVIGEPPDRIHRYEDDSLTRVLTASLPGTRITDIAGDGRGTLFCLVQQEGAWRAVRFDHRGTSRGSVAFTGIPAPIAFVFLQRSQRFVLLAGKDRQHRCLYWFSADGGKALFSIAVAALHPCFVANVIGSEARDRILLGGADGAEFGGASYVLILDADGNMLGEVPLGPHDTHATGVAATRDSLLVTGQHGLLRFRAAEVMPDDADEARSVLVTPALFSPDREDQRRWLRVEASAVLPEGSTLEVSHLATDDTAVRDRLHALAANESMTASQRVSRLLSDPDLRRERTEFRGSDPHGTAAATSFSARLFDARERYLWIVVTLTASAGAHLPSLSELAVLYPGRTLMESLPAIYQREESRPESFLRGLVGVLETTTQNLDARIGSLGSRIHPATSDGDWLDFIAQWTGVPWNDSLDVAQKRCLVTHAGEIAEKRGTRAGLELLLECLIPGPPRRFRVTDPTADFGFAIVGGESCGGSRLPAMLGGRTEWSAKLGSQSVLGVMRLPREKQLDDGTLRIAGQVVVEVAATAQERARWEPWLRSVIAQVVPLTARLAVRWVSAHALRSNRLDGTMTLESPPTPHLGTDAITNLARLPDRGVRLSSSGPGISRRLG
jgi:phage tail-like protein